MTEADTIAEMIDEITKVASSGGGGGGSSDITTATVTVTKGAGQTTDESAFVYAIFGKSAGSFEVPFMSIEYGGLDQGAIEYTILLYQGCYYMEDEFGSVESASGNVETITGDLFNTYRIYGDCAFVTKELFDM